MKRIDPGLCRRRSCRDSASCTAVRLSGAFATSFVVERGRALGVIGRNGAGKSTLLRILAGISRPDEGKITVRGRVGGLLELTAGFHSDLTGRENVFIGGVIRGLTRVEVRDRFDPSWISQNYTTSWTSRFGRTAAACK